MSRPGGLPSAAEHMQVAAEDERRAKERIGELMTECVKAIAVLNGGGVIAVLGFTQALVGKTQFHDFKPYALSAACLFLFGAVAAAFSFVLRWQEEVQIYNRAPDVASWTWSALIAIAAAFLAFIGGALAVCLGIADRL